MSDKPFDPVTEGTPDQLWEYMIIEGLNSDIIAARDAAMRRKALLEEAAPIIALAYDNLASVGEETPILELCHQFLMKVRGFVTVAPEDQAMEDARLAQWGNENHIRRMALLEAAEIAEGIVGCPHNEQDIMRNHILRVAADAIRTAAEKISDPLQVEERCNGKEEKDV